jgi:hypothetical protein
LFFSFWFEWNCWILECQKYVSKNVFKDWEIQSWLLAKCHVLIDVLSNTFMLINSYVFLIHISHFTFHNHIHISHFTFHNVCSNFFVILMFVLSYCLFVCLFVCLCVCLFLFVSLLIRLDLCLKVIFQQQQQQCVDSLPNKSQSFLNHYNFNSFISLNNSIT